MTRIEELEAIEQPLDVIVDGNGGDFGLAEHDELRLLRLLKRIVDSAGKIDCDGYCAVNGDLIEEARDLVEGDQE